MTEKEITAIMIVEVAGRPAEYVRESIEVHVSRLDQMKNITVVSKKFSEPKRMEHKEEVYTCFAEIEFSVPTFQEILGLIFDFMPSSIEIVDPGMVEMDSQEATEFVNNLAGRLHRYDEIAKIAQFRVKQLSDELTQLKQKEKPAQVTKKGKTKPKKKKSKA